MYFNCRQKYMKILYEKKNMAVQDDKTRIRVLFILPATRRRLEKDKKKSSLIL